MSLLPHRTTLFLCTAFCTLSVFPLASAKASTITCIVGGEASATITTGTNSVTIQLRILFVNPNTVADNFSAFLFTLSNMPSAASLTSSSGTEITVNGDGSPTPGSTVATGWVLSLTGAQTTLDVLSGAGRAGPAHTIIGAPGTGGYTSGGDGSLLATVPITRSSTRP